MDLDDYQEEIGGISNYQVMIIIALGLGTFGQGYTSQYAVFISAVPDYRFVRKSSLTRFSNHDYASVVIYVEGNVPPYGDALALLFCSHRALPRNSTARTPPTCSQYSKCYRYAYNLTNCDSNCNFPCITNEDDVSTIPCDSGYHYDDTIYGETTTSQWDLVCERRYLDTIAQTLFFLGFFIGSAIVGPLADWFGRKITVMILLCALMATSVGSAFVPTYELFAFLRVLVGASSMAVFIAMFTYGNEISNTKWRTETSAWICMGSACSHSVYPGIAYLLRDWRYIQLAISLLLAPTIIIWFFLPETPRWLMNNEKTKEARKIINKYATSKGKILTDEQWELIVETERNKRKNDNEKKTAIKKVRVWDLFRRPLMRLMCFNVAFSWFTASMVFYGLALNGGNLAGDPYLNTALNALVEVAGAFATYFAGLLGRKPVLVTSFIMAGLSCISSMLCDLSANGNSALLTASTALAITGKFFATLSFNTIYAVTAEIFPTNARTTGVSLGSMAARVGSMLSPLILEVQMSVPWFTQTLFGTLSIVAAFLTILFPETSDISLLTSLDKAEDYYRENIPVIKWFRSKSSSENGYLQKTGKENFSFDDSKEGMSKSEETREDTTQHVVQATPF